jgi:hypothetical protein
MLVTDLLIIWSEKGNRELRTFTIDHLPAGRFTIDLKKPGFQAFCLPVLASGSCG